jgi:hypothetical protein
VQLSEKEDQNQGIKRRHQELCEDSAIETRGKDVRRSPIEILVVLDQQVLGSDPIVHRRWNREL